MTNQLTSRGAFVRDDNGVPITNGGLIIEKTITYAAATTGAVGATTLFTVTGTVWVNVIGFCTDDLAGDGNISVGTSSSTACLCGVQNAVAIDNHEAWADAILAVGGAVAGHHHPVNQDIIQTIAGDTVTGGTITFYCCWSPLSEDGNIVVA